jgi:hypothetical protein
MATMFVMYTLKRQGKRLLGPIHKRSYASFAPKRHAFEIARREANKRGFLPGSGKPIQVVTDGDNDLAHYTAEIFPEAIVTIDVVHVVEKLWAAGEYIHPETSRELRHWVETQKDRLYSGKVDQVLAELDVQHARIPRTGPGNKGRRERLENTANYIRKRKEKMNYDVLIEQDLEISSGAIEGAVKNVIGKRCDHGGMRWIKERVEGLVQLRCIELHGDWDAFIEFAQGIFYAGSDALGARLRVQSSIATPLPSMEIAA